MSLVKEEKTKILEKAGWHTYYHEDYWVHSKTISDANRQDFSNYGMSLDDAFIYEIGELPPFDYCGLPMLGKWMTIENNKGLVDIAIAKAKEWENSFLS